MIRHKGELRGRFSNWKISIVGVGAAAQLYHLPAIRYIGGTLHTIVDVNRATLDYVSAIWSPRLTTTNIEDINATNTHVCIISTPPDSHLPIAQQLIRKGVNVLVEKPLVLSMKEYEILHNEVEQSRATCFGGQVRRFFPNIMLLKKVVQTKILGELRQLKIAEGAPFSWRTLSGYIAKWDDEGVITDTGAHVFDIIAYLLGREELNFINVHKCIVDRYPQTNNLHLIFSTSSNIAVDVRISRTTRLANKIYAITDNAVIFTDSGFTNDHLKIFPTKFKPTLFELDVLRSNYNYNVNYAFVLQLCEVLKSLEAAAHGDSCIHYTKLDKTIMFFDIVRKSYEVVQKVSWEDVKWPRF